MNRLGAVFDFGWPHFFEGVCYSWPNQKVDYDKLFLEKRDGLSPLLLVEMKKQISAMGVSTSVPPYPNVQQGERGLAMGLGDGGRWIELWKMMGSYFINGHNLDSWKDNAAAFNIGSHVLEYLAPGILAPRVRNNDGDWEISYPLPAGIENIDYEDFPEDPLRRIYEIVGLNPDFEIIREHGLQKVVNGNGEIFTENGFCKTRGFKRWDVPKSSFVASKLLSLTDPNF